MTFTFPFRRRGSASSYESDGYGQNPGKAFLRVVQRAVSPSSASPFGIHTESRLLFENMMVPPLRGDV